MNEQIFIPINACNEKDLVQTVLGAINNAEYPNRLSFGIFEHSLSDEFSDFSNIKQELYHVKVSYGGPLGVGLPRVNSSLLNSRKKDFVLQIDAHMLFEKNWDTDLIKYYSLISQNYNKPIISSYVPWWYENNNKEVKLSADESYIVDTNNFLGIKDLKTSKLIVDNFDSILHKGHVTLTGSNVDWSNEKQYEQHYGISGHFMFSSFDIIENILHDPFIPWGGDELLTALRAWTRGYRIFTIPKPIVWHKNKWGPSVNDIGVIALDKNDWRVYENSPNKTLYRVHGDNLSFAFRRIKDILLGDYLGYWGAPSLDLLKEYEDTIGVKFKDYYDMAGRYLKSNNPNLYRIIYE